jgi:hypothetical protein
MHTDIQPISVSSEAVDSEVMSENILIFQAYGVRQADETRAQWRRRKRDALKALEKLEKARIRKGQVNESK